MSSEAGAFGAVVGLGTVLVICLGAGLYGCPRYNVYSAKMTGEAELAQATQNRQVRAGPDRAGRA